ncbi:hypothetical protein OG21DRAFT_1512765 [Imleria badia]|nr:hypothetical protein OG21DRAFT_1512765 [Imleria badia]
MTQTPNTDVPGNKRGWLDFFSEVLSTTCDAVREATSHFFDTLRPHVVTARNAMRNFVTRHPWFMIGLIVLGLVVFLTQPWAGVFLKMWGITVWGVRIGIYPVNA